MLKKNNATKNNSHERCIQDAPRAQVKTSTMRTCGLSFHLLFALVFAFLATMLGQLQQALGQLRAGLAGLQYARRRRWRRRERVETACLGLAALRRWRRGGWRGHVEVVQIQRLAAARQLGLFRGGGGSPLQVNWASLFRLRKVADNQCLLFSNNWRDVLLH